MATKRKAPVEPDAPSGSRHTVEIMPLGAGQEVGRSCIILKYLNKTIMLDCGLHPGHHGMQALPFFDDVDLAEVDLALITHFHLDHCAAVPYLACKTKFKGRIFMTHPTKAVYSMLLSDAARIGSAESQLYSAKDVETSLAKVEVIDFHQTITIDGVQICAYRAGHVLGAAMFMVEIAGMRCLYTGDYSRHADRHMPPADLPELKPHIVIVEATYGVSRHQPRQEREEQLCVRVRDVLLRDGRVLMPCVALGRAQELMLILEEYWKRTPALHNVPIYTVSGIAARALGIYQTYIEMMGEDIKQAFQAVRNPFHLQHVAHLRSTKEFHDTGPCVVMATPSGLQGGASRDLFDAWCGDARNGLLLCDFAVQGTLAREVLGEPSHVHTRHGSKVPLKMSVDAISFSAHADFPQTSQFIEALNPRHVVLVHGEVNEMFRLKKALEQQASNLEVERTLHTPKDAQAVLIHHRALHVAKVVGKLADKAPKAGMPLSGLLVRQGLRDTLLHPDDLATFTKLRTGTIKQTQSLLLARPWMQVRLALEVVFEGAGGGAALDLGAIRGLQSDGNRLLVCEQVQLTHTPSTGTEAGRVDLEWQGGHQADLVADACVAVIMQASMAPPGVRAAQAARRVALRQQDPEAAERAEVALLVALLGAQFGPAEANLDRYTIQLQVDDVRVLVHHKSGEVECSNLALQSRVAKAVTRLRLAMGPASRDEDSDGGLDEEGAAFEDELKPPDA